MCFGFKFISFFMILSQIKKFKNAMAKHGIERCGLKSAKGLDESNVEISSGLSISIKSVHKEYIVYRH